KTVFIRFPHLNARVWHRVSVGVSYGSFNPGRLAAGAVRNVSTQRYFGCVVHKKWPKYSGFSSVLVSLIIYRNGLHRNAQGVRKQHEFLALVVSNVPNFSEKVDGVFPFTLREADVANVVVQVHYQALKQEF